MNDASRETRAPSEGQASSQAPSSKEAAPPPPPSGSAILPRREVTVSPLEYFCKTCDKNVGGKWLSACPFCRAFGSIAVGASSGSTTNRWIGSGQKPQLLSDVPEADFERISTGTREFDRVLGGGIVTGSTVLISGDPGIGKSTLLLQVGIDLSVAPVTEVEDEEGETKGPKKEKASSPIRILYVSAEETNSQIKDRAKRLSMDSKYLYLHNESDITEIAKQIAIIDPDILITDSIQTMVSPTVEGAAGSVTQVRECALYLIDICKRRGIGHFLVCHITKEGHIAGPKVLEHLVDVTLEFHKEGTGDLRSIRANKNRFGNTTEMALFQMTATGLHSIENPSELLLKQHKDGRPGSCVGLIVAGGSRPLAVEFQSLLGPTLLNAQGVRGSKLITTGLSSQRATQVAAVLQRVLGVDLLREVFINVPGGLDDIKDPALDLPLALAITSRALNVALPESFIAFGEIGLVGEVRPVSYIEARVKTAMLMGFQTIIGPPQASYETTDIVAGLLRDDERGDADGGRGQYFPVSSVEEAFGLLEGFVIAPPEVKQSKRKNKRRSPFEDQKS